MSVEFVVEPVIIGQRPPSWGDLDPATKNLTGTYNSKTPGACTPEQSTVTEENGYINIVTLPPGMSPAHYIQKRKEELEA